MGKGLSPRIRVAAPTGATITGTLGGDTVSFTEKGTGVYEADVEKLGPWTVTGVGSKTDTRTVSVDDVGLFDGGELNLKALNDYTWAEISAISQAGTGANYVSIGDAKEITINGTIGTKAFDNVTLCVFILDFNHPENGVADNNIIWGGFKTALTGGVDVCLDDANYNTFKTDGTKTFNMNHWGNYNYGGWKGCDLRYDILGAVETQPSDYGKQHTTSCVGYDATTAAITSPKTDTLMAAIPADLRAVLRLWNRWIDAVGNKSNVDANIQKTVDAGISLLAEFEVQGTRTLANEFEQNHQTQMAYYANGNSKVRKKQSATGTSAHWGVSSANYAYTTGFCYTSAGGSASSHDVRGSSGVAPAFKT